MFTMLRDNSIFVWSLSIQYVVTDDTADSVTAPPPTEAKLDLLKDNQIHFVL